MDEKKSKTGGGKKMQFSDREQQTSGAKKIMNVQKSKF